MHNCSTLPFNRKAAEYVDVEALMNTTSFAAKV